MYRFVAATALAAGIGAPAVAAPVAFDFTIPAERYEAEAGREGTWREAFPDGTWTVGGIGVSLSGIGGDPFLDTEWRRGDSPGVGLCEIEDCNARPEDGLTAGEAVVATFTSPVRFLSAFFRESTDDFDLRSIGRDHTPVTGRVGINGTFYDVVNGVAQGLPSLFASEWTITADEGATIYWTSATVAPIPVPAAGLLLLGALGGLGLAARRKARG